MGSARAEVVVLADNTAVRTILTTLLTAAGFAVSAAPEGTSCLERLSSHPARLVVVLDWLMPGPDGLAMVHALADDTPGIRRHAFLLLAALYTGPTLRFLLPPGVPVTVMRKPFAVADFLDAVAQATQTAAQTATEW